ncbi:primosomal protein N' [Suttonella sp. R2A3]|uniref:primosomal protein N' n=1 Tax=Suttonella sp. R2A3 TaxID=2908648 RepID=UPI001F24A798|nr:primosomal protein N' [Suttonella sp. R2A3]UJF25259.1 primosomal protein N' [Suttonella sp. R2A3]
MSVQRIEVALNRPLHGSFSYLSDQPLAVGVRVRVPFARQKLVGVVLACQDEAQAPAVDYALKSVDSVLDDAPVIGPELMALLTYAARYYQHPLGEVIHAALPKLLRDGADNARELSVSYTLTEEGQLALEQRLGAKQQAVLQALEQGSQTMEALQQSHSVSAAWLRDLAERGWLSAQTYWQVPEKLASADAPELSAAQQHVLEAISQTENFAVHLLDGVTGSGKTEIYIRLLAERLADGGQALVLVPEIGLVQAMSEALRRRLPFAVVTHHSGLSDKARLDSWQAVAAGEAQIVVGTRSALFSPFRDLRVLIVDEEHDQAYKQQDGFRYHARDMAIVRGQKNQALVLLGSATPSLESYHQVWQGKWRYHQLSERIRAQAPAEIVLLDGQSEASVGGLHPRLLTRIRRTLQDGKQVMLFLNRRGYAPLLYCGECGWKSDCSACDATMTAHTRSHRLQCHHCGRQAPLPLQCPNCGTSDLVLLGMGTQRLEQTITQQIPQARVLRMDSDAFTTAKQFNEAVGQIHRGEVDIVLGTQWLSKGHHFANLHLVAVVDVDQGLFSPDFRGEERLAQLLVQVGGRAGREDQGEVWLQTSQPQHPLFTVLHQPYQKTAKRLYEQRQVMGLPPTQAQALLLATHRDAARAMQALQWTRQGAAQAIDDDRLLWLGPAPAVMARKDGRHRAQLLIQAADKAMLQRYLPTISAWLTAQGEALHVRVQIDVDPQGME